jgi:membrane-associated phospholipid phosphatase
MFRIGLLFSRSVLLACICALPATGQVPSPTPSTTPAKAASGTRVEASDFLKNIVSDQKAIWTSPFHLHQSDWKWLGPFLGGTAALIATDKTTSGWVTRTGPLRSISRDVSFNGGIYVAGGVSAGMYAIGRWTHNDHLRETGLLAGEALIDSQIVTQAAKLVFQRQRPNQADGDGEFFSGKGSSFFSGHASSSFAVATVIACEYHNHPLAVWGSYGVATAVSLSRYTGRKHYLSDVLVGAAVGYGVGRYVCVNRAMRADSDDDPDNTVSRHWSVLPYLNARTGAKGGSLVWQF